MAQDGIALRAIADVLGDTEAVVERTYRKMTPEYQRAAASAKR